MSFILVGTPEYMSPEQVRGERVDFQSDIYALGIILFEILTGDVPFRADTPVGVIYKQINEPPALDHRPGREIPDAFIPVLHRCLAKRPVDRYASALEMRGVLASLAIPGGGDVTDLRIFPARGPSADTRASTITSLRPVHEQLAPASLWTEEDPTEPMAQVEETPPRVPKTRAREGTPAPGREGHGTSSTPPTSSRRRNIVALGGLAAVVLAVLGTLWSVLGTDSRSAGGQVPRVEASVPSSPQGSEQLPSPARDDNPDVAQTLPPSTIAQVVPLGPPPRPIAPLNGQEIAFADPSIATIRLAWQPGASGGAFHVKVDFDGGFARPLVDENAWKRTSMELRGLDVGRYYWKVAAVDAGGRESAFSSAQSFSVVRDPARPAVAAAIAPTTAPSNRGTAEPSTPAASEPRPAPGGFPPPTTLPERPILVPTPAPLALPAAPDSGATVRPSPLPAAASSDPTDEVRSALAAYKAAFESLDPGRVRAVFPGISDGELDALRTFKEYQLTLDKVAIEVRSPSSARVTCMVGVTVRSAVGKRFSYPSRKTVMEFERSPGGWVRRQ